MCVGHDFVKILILCCAVSKVAAYQNYFPNFFCGTKENLSTKKCEARNIMSTSDLQSIFDNFRNHQFYVNDRYYGNTIRNQISEYNEIEFKDCRFEKFPTGSYSSYFAHIISIKAENVGFTKLNRDSFTSFTSLKVLELSNNNITTLENNVLSYLKSLVSINLSHNQIETISSDAFEECSHTLNYVDLAYNKIKRVHENIFKILGANTVVVFNLENNNVEEVTDDDSLKQFKLLNLGHNKLTKFEFICSNIDKLILNDNFLKEVKIPQCNVGQLDLRNNSLTHIENTNASEIYISDSVNLKNLTLNFKSLKKLGAANIPSKIITYEFLQNAHQLTELDMSNTFLGTPKIDTFSEMTQLEDLKLRNTGLSHIEYGMFGHQVNMKNFDISYNNLGHIDIEMLASMKALETLDISANNLTSFNDVNDFKRNFPNLTLIGIEDNNWNCSYLTKAVKVFYENSISIKQPAVPIKSSSNVMGIVCTTTSNQKIKPIDADHAKDLVSQKLNEIIEQINAEKVNNNNAKYDGDIIRAELFHLQREMIDIKSKLLRVQITEVINNKNDSKGADMTVIKHIEQLTNFTLEKQKLANDQLKLKIDELQVELTRNSIEHDKFVQKNNMKDYRFSNNEVTKYDSIKSSNEIHNNSGTTNVLLAIVMTILAVIGVVFGYSKLKNLLYRRNETPSVLARSTNTMNTTVEIPFDDRKF